MSDTPQKTAAAPQSSNPAVPDPLDEAGVGAAVEQALAAFAAATTLDGLKAARLAHTGEKSPLSLANREIGGLSKEFKAAAGKLMGASRGRVAKALAARTEVLEAEDAARILVEETVDVTAAPRRRRAGARHPLSTLQDRVCDIFVGMGWEIAEGPELESEWFNFDALNFKPDHPAREMQDTFFVEPPEAHLRGTLDHFVKTLFGDEARVRLRPNYFPFTEPSAELDLWHPTFKGGARWIEWGGCGMVNPNVLRSAGIDPDVYSGFAFGMGVERALMFRNDVQDMRDMAEGDVRFSQQFGMVV
jgi:phenylalanyl-tRNA synthetase alpha subunit